MKKTICRTLCLILLIVLVIPFVSSCKKNKIFYELGDYSITKKEYIYLSGMFKKKVMVSLDPDLTDADLSYEMENGVTINDYIEATYREGFEQSVLSLLYAQSMFDTLGLSLTDTEKSNIRATASAIAAYYGNYDMDAFNKIAEEYGFDYDTLLSVYEKQYKENKVRQYLLGENNEKITEKQKNDYYEENYLRYQTIVINTMYKIHTDSFGESTVLPLNEDEKAEKELLVTELKELLINKNMDYDYILLKDKLSWTYEELWEEYDDDSRTDGHYKNGCYQTSKPTLSQLQSNNVLSAAYVSREGEIKNVVAHRYFGGDTPLKTEDGETIHPGDYFEYGTVFVKRLPLDDKAYENEENKLFFSSFMPGLSNYVYYQALMEHEKSLPYSTMVSEKVSDYLFKDVKANELDYYYIYEQ